MDLLGVFKKDISVPPPPNIALAKAALPQEMDLVKGKPTSEFKALNESPFMLLDALGYKDKPASLTYSVLKQMATRNAVIAAIILTRTNQVSTFTKPARFSKDGLGYEIRTKDPDKTPTKEEKDIMLALELFLENCGFSDDNDRDDFDTFVRKVTRDSLTFDQCTFEIVTDKVGRPAAFYAVDASTIRVAGESFNNANISAFTDVKLPTKNQEVKWVQVMDNVVMSWFTNNELAFGVRNPRTDINMSPYGFSELEQLIHQITSHLYAEEYNMRFFSQGGTTKGIINIKGQFQPADKENIEAFKRQWKAQVSGITGAWKTPIVQAPDGLEYINVGSSNREMEFEKWMNYLINVACAVFQIDPAEVNFPNNGGVGGTGGGIFEGNNEGRLKNSKDKGLRPLLRFLETMINRYIISRFSNEFVFNFVGIDSKTDAEIVDLDGKAVKVYKTVNEIRKEHDMEPIEGGDTILDSSFINMMSQKQMMEQQQQQMAGQDEEQDQQNEQDIAEENPYNFDNTDVDEEWDAEQGESVAKSETLEIIIED